MTENIENRTDDNVDPTKGTLAGAVDGSRSTDDGVPVGEADVDADRERSGADAEETDQGGPSTLFGAGWGGGGQTDDGVPVGAADADADAERSR